jgi:hypothetical protein
LGQLINNGDLVQAVSSLGSFIARESRSSRNSSPTTPNRGRTLTTFDTARRLGDGCNVEGFLLFYSWKDGLDDTLGASQCISNPADQTVLRLGGDAAAGSRLNVHVTKGRAPPAATDSTCDFLLRLLATSELPSVYINGRQSAVPPPLSGQVLSHFFQETRTCLGKVLLDCMILNEDQCLALTTMSRFDVEVNISNCSLVDDAAGAFIECLQCDRGPVELIHCHRESRSPA